MKSWFADGFRFLRAGLFPDKCLICCQEGTLLCSDHALKLRPKRVQLSATSSLNAVWAATDYGDVTSAQVIKALKYKRQRDYLQIIVDALKPVLRLHDLTAATFVPVPLSYWRWQHRGFNQAQLIAEELAQSNRSEVCLSLQRAIYTTPQARLSKTERSRNVAGAFRWRGNKKAPCTVFLVDDVYTTGSTLEACAKTLRAHGSENIIGIVFSYNP